MHIQSVTSKPSKKYPIIKIGTNVDGDDIDNVFTDASSTVIGHEDTNSLSNWSDTIHSINNFSDDCISRNSLLPNSYYFPRLSSRRYVPKIYMNCIVIFFNGSQITPKLPNNTF